MTAAIIEVVAAQGGPTEAQQAQLAQPQAESASVRRYAPMELSAHEEPQLRAMHLDALVDTALSLFGTRDGRYGPQDVPSAYTKKNNTRAMHTANGVVARSKSFTTMHIDPARVRARNRFVAMAQDRLTIAVEEHGIDAVATRLAQVLVDHGPRHADSDEDEYW